MSFKKAVQADAVVDTAIVLVHQLLHHEELVLRKPNGRLRVFVSRRGAFAYTVQYGEPGTVGSWALDRVTSGDAVEAVTHMLEDHYTHRIDRRCSLVVGGVGNTPDFTGTFEQCLRRARTVGEHLSWAIGYKGGCLVSHFTDGEAEGWRRYRNEQIAPSPFNVQFDAALAMPIGSQRVYQDVLAGHVTLTRVNRTSWSFLPERAAGKRHFPVGAVGSRQTTLYLVALVERGGSEVQHDRE